MKIEGINLYFTSFIILILNVTKCLPQVEDVIKFHEYSYCENTSQGRKFAIIVHGWQESCQESWASQLVENLKRYRGGCIICMDYRSIARMPNYFMIAAHNTDMALALTHKLKQLENLGFDPNQGYMFGFSLGGRIVLEAGRLYGIRKIAEIDTCDMAGPGFDRRPNRTFDPKESAQNVQCIHTSADKGTIQRNCHQDWNMGFCGYHQIGAENPPHGSHSLCPKFYNSAFENDFLAEQNPQQCISVQIERPYWPRNFKMGYMEDRKNNVFGEFYASTTQTFPYTPNTLRVQISTGPIKPLDGYKYKVIMVLNNRRNYFRRKKALLQHLTARNLALYRS